MTNQTRLLDQIWKHKYLTVSQILTLWRPQGKRSLYNLLLKLRDIRFIDKHDYKFNARYGKLEDMYFLKSRWAHYLETKWYEPWMHKLPTSKHAFYDDYLHRKRTIDIQIRLTQLRSKLALKISFYHHYFERARDKSWRYQCATKFFYDQWFIKSDSAALIGSIWTDNLFLLEYHQWHRLQKICKQIKQYSLILAQWSASVKYDCTSNPRILLVFEKKQTMISTIEHINSDKYYLYLKPYYRFSSYDDLMVTPWECRVNMTGAWISFTSLFQTQIK